MPGVVWAAGRGKVSVKVGVMEFGL